MKDAEILKKIKIAKEERMEDAKQKYHQKKHAEKLAARATRGEKLTTSEQEIVDKASKADAPYPYRRENEDQPEHEPYTGKYLGDKEGE